MRITIEKEGFIHCHPSWGAAGPSGWRLFSMQLPSVFFALTGVKAGLNYFYYLGLGVTAAALFYQHLIVSPKDLSRIQASFFSMNGTISVTIFLATWLSLLTS